MNFDNITIKEFSLIIGISETSIRRSIKLWFPEKMKKGIKTILNEKEVTLIKKDLERHHNNKDKRLNRNNLLSIIKFMRGENI